MTFETFNVPSFDFPVSADVQWSPPDASGLTTVAMVRDVRNAYTDDEISDPAELAFITEFIATTPARRARP